MLRVVKAGFNQRRKTLRNALKTLQIDLDVVEPSHLALRAEQLSVAQYVELTNQLSAASATAGGTDAKE